MIALVAIATLGHTPPVTDNVNPSGYYYCKWCSDTQLVMGTYDKKGVFRVEYTLSDKRMFPNDFKPDTWKGICVLPDGAKDKWAVLLDGRYFEKRGSAYIECRKSYKYKCTYIPQLGSTVLSSNEEKNERIVTGRIYNPHGFHPLRDLPSEYKFDEDEFIDYENKRCRLELWRKAFETPIIAPRFGWKIVPFPKNYNTRCMIRVLDNTMEYGELFITGEFNPDLKIGPLPRIELPYPINKTTSEADASTRYYNTPQNGKKSEQVYEYVCGRLVLGVLKDDGYFYPEVGSKVIAITDFNPLENKRRIYNLPGILVRSK